MRKVVAYTAVLLFVAAGYAAWTIYSRWSANRAAEQSAKQKEVEDDRRLVESIGGNELKILSFYPSAAVVKPGGRALICYGVSNAKAVRIEPRVEDLTPSLSRCFEVFPKKTTEYKLTAEDGAGHSASQSLTLTVK